MNSEVVSVGDVVAVALPNHRPDGREQEGFRPAIVVGLPDFLGVPRFPVALVVPLTSDRQQAWALESPSLYPRLPAATGGLRSPSIVLLDQLRSLDARRLRRYLGSLSTKEYASIRNGLNAMFAQPQITQKNL